MTSVVASTRSSYEPGSFRDRNGRVFYAGDQIFRGLSPRAQHNWELLSTRRFFRRAVCDGSIVATESVDESLVPQCDARQGWSAFLRHDRIPFVSYPYEWSFGMLRDAATLQLELLEAALEEDMSLKDGSAFNIQWIGARPVFIDIPSFESLPIGEPWAGYRQFCQTMLYPLMLQAYKHIPFQPWLRGSLDGIEPDHCWHLMSLGDLLRRGVLTHVYLHAKLQARYGGTRRNVKADLSRAGFHKGLIQSNIARLRSLVERFEWNPPRSTWSEYTVQLNYTESDRAAKAEFVRRAAAERPRGIAWDLGSNTGEYARIAADHAAYVVAMDSDHLAIERQYRALRAEGRGKILPLVCNLVDPAPNLGWRGRERMPLLDRGRPDLVLALALIHHLVIGANVPLADFVAWLGELDADLVIEFPHKDDTMVQTLLRHKRDDYTDYDLHFFEHCLAQHFHIARRQTLGSGTRTLFHAVARPHAAP